MPVSACPDGFDDVKSVVINDPLSLKRLAALRNGFKQLAGADAQFAERSVRFMLVNEHHEPVDGDERALDAWLFARCLFTTVFNF